MVETLSTDGPPALTAYKILKKKVQQLPLNFGDQDLPVASSTTQSKSQQLQSQRSPRAPKRRRGQSRVQRRKASLNLTFDWTDIPDNWFEPDLGAELFRLPSQTSVLMHEEGVQPLLPLALTASPSEMSSSTIPTATMGTTAAPITAISLATTPDASAMDFASTAAFGQDLVMQTSNDGISGFELACSSLLGGQQESPLGLLRIGAGDGTGEGGMVYISDPDVQLPTPPPAVDFGSQQASKGAFGVVTASERCPESLQMDILLDGLVGTDPWSSMEPGYECVPVQGSIGDIFMEFGE
ncbi:hypothetical protein SEUCBS140593_003768 [Sporothrix eucalyptigena]|uniref:Uncharacterized protein n=1 Tax=Sporothrix eucalyptigena TaxID=1812306 RepID=A0ABP0BIR5_9PEZI